MEKTVIRHTVEKAREGTYYTLPFAVPPHTESFTVTYRYGGTAEGRKGKSTSVIDLGITDCDGRFIGWSGSARDHVTVGEFSSTNGYFCQPIKAGNWQIIVGAYKVDPDGTCVEYTIEYEEKRRRLYYGDLHMHSTASDGRYTAARLGEMAKKAGLDFIAVADHNNYCENFSLPRIQGITFIPAVEWTHYKGHMNFYGLKAPFENSFIANSLSDMKSLIAEVRQRGAAVSVNHPECDLCPYLWDDDDAYDMMEIWNGPMRAANMRAIDRWTRLLSSGRKIPAVCGSDFHRRMSPVRIGRPASGVYSEDASPEGLLAAIRAGHLFVSSSPEGPRLLLTCGDKLMGDTVFTEDRFTEITVRADNLRGCRLFLVTGRGEAPISEGTAVLTPDCRFAYVKALRFGVIRAVTNPVYFRQGRNAPMP